MERKELSWHDRGRLWLRLIVRAVLTAAVLLLLIQAGPPLLELCMPFLLALLVAWLLNPLVKTLQKRTGAPRKALALVLVLVLFGLVGGALFAFSYSAVSELLMLASNWQSLWQDVLDGIDQLSALSSGLLELLPPAVADTAAGLVDRFVSWAQTAVPTLLGKAASRAGTWAMGLPSFGVALVVFVMGAYFISADYPRLRFLVTDRLSPELRTFFRMVKTTAGSAFGGYFRAQLILSVGVFFILLLGFILIRQPYSMLLAFLLAVLDFIPILGSGTVMVPWAAVSLVTGDVRMAVSLLVIWGVVSLFRRMGEPKVLGSQTGLSPILSLVSIYVGMKLGGVAGMVLGPILCLVVLNILRSGIFEGAAADLRLAARDLDALLRNRPQP